MAESSLATGKYVWKIEDFSKLTKTKYHSSNFSIAGCKWRIVFYPRGNNIDNFCSLYLVVADARLHLGWSIAAKVSLKILNQKQIGYSTIRVTPCHLFSSEEMQWGSKAFKNLADLHDHSKGFVVQNTLVIEAEVVVDNKNLLLTSEFNTYFTNLEGLLASSVEEPVRSSSASKTTPCPNAVKEAEQTLRECLKQNFHLEMIEKVRAALLVLTRAEAGTATGLSNDQLRLVKSLLANYSDFVSGFTSVEIDRSVYEVQNIAKERMLSTMKKNHETHISYNKLLSDLSGEEKQLLEKLEEVKLKKRKLLLDWENLMAETNKVKSRYTDQEKKVAETGKRMRSAQKRKAASEATWSELKEQLHRRKGKFHAVQIDF